MNRHPLRPASIRDDSCRGASTGNCAKRLKFLPRTIVLVVEVVNIVQLKDTMVTRSPAIEIGGT